MPLPVPVNRNPDPKVAHAMAVVQELGFEHLQTSTVTAPRIFAMTSAEEKRGKTHFACGLPSPILALSWDTGTQPIMQDVAVKQLGKQVAIKTFIKANALSAKDGAMEWQRVVDVCNAIALCPPAVCRSLLIDTGSAMWELCRLATLGKLTQVKSHHYGVANTAFESVFAALYGRPDLNVIITHKTGKKYVNDTWDGKSSEPKMYSGMPFIVDLVLQHYARTEPDKTTTYGIHVLESRFEMSRMRGLLLESNVTRDAEHGGPVDECNVATLGDLIFGNGVDAWE